MNDADYSRIEAEIASDDSPVGIDAKKTHIMILAKLESIERRLDAIERGGDRAIPSDGRTIALDGIASATDAFDDEVSRLRERGVDIDERARAGLRLIETLSEPRTLAALEAITRRVAALEPMTEMLTHGPDALAAGIDAFDEEVSRLRERGIEVDAVLRNGLAALLLLGQRVSTQELEALGALLRSDVLHPRAVDVVGRLGCALVAAAETPLGSVGPFGAVGKLGDHDARRSTAFVLEFARHFGRALQGTGEGCTTPINTGARS